MFLSKAPSGIWYLWYVDEQTGKKRKKSTQSKLKTDALKFLQSFRQEHIAATSKTNLAAFITEFLTYAGAVFASGTVEIYKATLRHFLTVTGDVQLSSITPFHFDNFKVARLNTVSPQTTNIELRALKAAFNTAFRWKKVSGNPFAGLKLAEVVENTPIFFTREDFQKLIAVIREGWVREMVVFATLTGLRRGEITNLRWQDVDLSRKLLTIQSNPTFRTKRGKKRIVPLSEPALYILQSHFGKDVSEYVFTLNGKKVLDDWLAKKLKNYVYECHFKDTRLHFHSLRHSFASWLAADGVSIHAISVLLGHSSVNITQQFYAHLSGEQLHKEVNKISLNLIENNLANN